MTIASNELKPCPFCGSVLPYLPVPSAAREGSFVVECINCSCEVFGRSRDEAASNWNRRAREVDEIVALKKQIDHLNDVRRSLHEQVRELQAACEARKASPAIGMNA
jgi:hypothetical protein